MENNPLPLSICLEDCHPAHESLRYLSCTAVSGRGLSLRVDGTVGWMDPAPAFCAILVTGDGRPACLRTDKMIEGARVHRAGRHVDLVPGKPVILRNRDILTVPGRCVRIHIHGEVAEPKEPKYLQAKEASSVLPKLAAAGIIALLGFGVGCVRETVVHEKPGDVTVDRPLPPRPDPPPHEEADDKGEDPIDVREHVPAPPLDDDEF